jgi:hypothetical protein
MASLMGMQHPHLGKMVNPKMETTGGTSSSQGIAAVMAKQKACNWILTMAHPSNSQSGPMQQQGRQGAPVLFCFLVTIYEREEKDGENDRGHHGQASAVYT